MNRPYKKSTDASHRPVILLMHPLTGCLVEEQQLYALLRRLPVAAVFWERSPDEVFPGRTPNYPDLYGKRYAAMVKHLAARMQVPCIRFPPGGVRRLLQKPAAFLPDIKNNWPEPGWPDPAPFLFPVGFPPEELRSAQKRGAHQYCRSSACSGVAIDWLCVPQQFYTASWEQLCQPLCGQKPADVPYTSFPPPRSSQGTMYLSDCGFSAAVDWDNTDRTSSTTSSYLYYVSQPSPMVFKSARLLEPSLKHFFGAEYSEKLYRLYRLGDILRDAQIENALPLFLLQENGRMTGFAMQDFSAQGNSLEPLLLKEENGGCSWHDALAWMEELCRCASFFHRFGIYFSDVKLNNFFISHSPHDNRTQIVPIDCDGFSVLGSTCSPRVPVHSDESDPPSYYHTSGAEDLMLARLILNFLCGVTKTPNDFVLSEPHTQELYDALCTVGRSDVPDADTWTAILYRCRMQLENRHAVYISNRLYVQQFPRRKALCLCPSGPEIPYPSQALEISFVPM